MENSQNTVAANAPANPKPVRSIAAKEYDHALMNYINGEYDKLSDVQRDIFCKDIPTFDNQNVTLRFLCKALGIDVPAKYERIADEQQSVAFRSLRVKPGDILLIIRSSQDFGTSELANQYEDAISRGAKIVIMGREEFEAKNLDEDSSPVILMDHSNERIYRFFSIIKQQHKAKVVQLTGSVGKTTTKDLCHTVAQSKFKTFANANNTNTPHQAAMHLFYNSTPDNEVFIHETGAGYFGSVRFAASMMQPDVLILTNVYSHHLQVYKTFENIFADKVSGDDYLSKDGVVITNYDDENIRNHKFKHTVKSFAINYADADYRAINIKQHQENLTFDVYEKETGITTPVTTKILGEHNVYNILTAFALGKTLGMTEAEIQDALLEYRAEGVRQNLTNVGGVHLLLDCYNVAEESILAMLSAGEKFELDGDGKRIALVGGENKLGKEVRKRSKAFGPQIAGMNIDQYLFCGTKDLTVKALNHFGDAQSIKAGFEEVSKIPCELSTSIADMTAYLQKNVKRNDLVMIKGIYYLQMPIAVDKVFGTSFSFDLSHNKAVMKAVQKDGYRSGLIEDFGELELTAAPVENGMVKIPDELEGYPVFRIKNDTFAGQSEITGIEFGKSVKNIGAKAFSGCTNLTELTVPKNVKVIESRAFSDCTGLQRATLKKGVTHISNKAFAGCSNLKEIRIPSTVGMIEENAFANCPNVRIACMEGSFAHNYAVENNIPFRYMKVKSQETNAVPSDKSSENKTFLQKLKRKARNVWKALIS